MTILNRKLCRLIIYQIFCNSRKDSNRTAIDLNCCFLSIFTICSFCSWLTTCCFPFHSGWSFICTSTHWFFLYFVFALLQMCPCYLSWIFCQFVIQRVQTVTSWGSYWPHGRSTIMPLELLKSYSYSSLAWRWWLSRRGAKVWLANQILFSGQGAS